MMSRQSAKERLIKHLRMLSREYQYIPALSQIFDFVADRAEQNQVIVEIPKVIHATYERRDVADLGWFWCPRCGRIEPARRLRGFRCSECGEPMVQGYLGPPILRAPATTFTRITVRPPSPRARGIRELIRPTVDIVSLWCTQLGRRKLLKVNDPERPVASLTLYCPSDSNPGCSHYGPEGRCDETKQGRVFFPRSSGESCSPYPPSEALTRSFCVSFHAVKDAESVEFERELVPGIERVKLARVDICELAISMSVGAPYSGRSKRRHCLVLDRNDSPYLLGRRLPTEALIVGLEADAVKNAVNRLKSKSFEATPFIVVHTIAHILLNIAPLITGLTPMEFGECIWIDEERGEYECVIYDAAKGGVGGVRTLVKDKVLDYDLYSYIPAIIDCPRACEAACRACVFSARCFMLNYRLNRHAVTQGIVDLNKCRELQIGGG